MTKKEELAVDELLALINVGAPIVIQKRYGCGLRKFVIIPILNEEPYPDLELSESGTNLKF
jgi:hypothetical protein